MATFKAEVYAHQKKSDGSYNVKIRVTHLRKKRYLSTSVFVFSEDLTKGLNIKNRSITDKLDIMVKQYYKDIEELGGAITYLEVDDIVKYIQLKDKERTEGKKGVISFYEYTNEMVKAMRKNKQDGTADNYVIMTNSLKRFAGDDLAFSDITIGFLKKYEDFLKDNGTGPRGYSLYMGLIRAVFNAAMKELNQPELNKIVIPYTPFSQYDIKKEPTPEKRNLPIETLYKIINFPDTRFRRPNLARDLFTLSYFLIGINSVDLLLCDEYKDGRLNYFRKKTTSRREDRAEFSLLVPDVVKPLIEKYKDPTGERVFRFHLDYADRHTLSAAINKGLKVIGKEVGVPQLQYYAARHSWGNIARNTLKISKYIVRDALNHSDPSMKVTELYSEKEWYEIDDANKLMVEYSICMFIIFKINEVLDVINEYYLGN